MRFAAHSLLVLCVLLAPISCLFGHTQGENYVVFKVWDNRIEGAVEIATDDLEERFGYEFPDSGDLLPVISANAAEVQAYIEENFSISANGKAFPIEFTEVDVRNLPDVEMDFAIYRFEMKPGVAIPQVLEIRHNMLYELGRLHRGLIGVFDTDVSLDEEWKAQMVFSSNNSVQELDLMDIPEMLGARAMVPQGVLHIWIGIDHILFLLCLLLPTVLMRREGEVVPVEKFTSVLWRVIKIVTLFTIAHSITLALAALDFISISSRLVESIIALSIVLVGLSNIIYRVSASTYVMILILGLFHGLGFASVMGDLPFQMKDVLKVVIGFNIGVEIGQIAIVAAVFPVLYFLRKHPLYTPVVLRGGSGALSLVAAYWFVQRALGLG